MGLDVLKKLKGEAQQRQKAGGGAERAAPKYEPAHRYFVSNNWKNLLDRRPTIAPKAAASTGPALGDAAANVVALDCEMVGVGTGGVRSALARVSIVDSEGSVLIDRYVLPMEEVTDYRTHITGITAATLRRPGVLREEDAIERAAALMSGKVVVGHSVQNDFQALRLSHPHAYIRDTALYRPYRPPGREKRMPSLQGLAAHWLHENIHDGHHDSVEDARVALRLYRLKSRVWEKQMRSAMRSGLLEADAAGDGAGESDDEGERVDAPAGKSEAKEGPQAKKRKKKKGKKAAAAESDSDSAEEEELGEDEGKGAAVAEAKPAYKNPGKKQRKRLRKEAQG